MKNLDIYNGFVLRYDEAVKYLDDIAVEHTMAVMRGEEDSEGSEKERYTNIMMDLMAGANLATDGSGRC